MPFGTEPIYANPTEPEIESRRIRAACRECADPRCTQHMAETIAVLQRELSEAHARERIVRQLLERVLAKLREALLTADRAPVLDELVRLEDKLTLLLTGYPKLPGMRR